MRLACIDGLRKENHSAIKAIREPVEVLVSAQGLAASHADRADDAVPLSVLCTPGFRSSLTGTAASILCLNSFFYLTHFVFIHGKHLHCFIGETMEVGGVPADGA